MDILSDCSNFYVRLKFFGWVKLRGRMGARWKVLPRLHFLNIRKLYSGYDYFMHFHMFLKIVYYTAPTLKPTRRSQTFIIIFSKTLWLIEISVKLSDLYAAPINGPTSGIISLIISKCLQWICFFLFQIYSWNVKFFVDGFWLNCIFFLHGAAKLVLTYIWQRPLTRSNNSVMQIVTNILTSYSWLSAKVWCDTTRVRDSNFLFS